MDDDVVDMIHQLGIGKPVRPGIVVGDRLFDRCLDAVDVNNELFDGQVLTQQYLITDGDTLNCLWITIGSIDRTSTALRLSASILPSHALWVS